MKQVPFFIGVLMIMPTVDMLVGAQHEPWQSGKRRLPGDRKVNRPNGYGVGTLMYAEQAILHEAIKEDIGNEAALYWVSGGDGSQDVVSSLGLDTIMDNIKYVSIEDCWYRIRRQVSRTMPVPKLIAGAGARVLHNAAQWVKGSQQQVAYPVLGAAPAAGTHFCVPPPAAGHQVMITLFAEEGGLLSDSGDDGALEMAVVVDRFQALA